MITNKINTYYSKLLDQYGATPQGVDWGKGEHYETQFQKLSKIIDASVPFSVLDFGCGYGVYINYLQKYYAEYTYYGYDINEDMLTLGEEKFPSKSHHWIGSLEGIEVDYVIVNGTFNVKFKQDEEQWYKYLFEQIDMISQIARKGFSISCLSAHLPNDKRWDEYYGEGFLFYAQPERILAYLMKTFPNVTFDHSYLNSEFCLTVSKSPLKSGYAKP